MFSLGLGTFLILTLYLAQTNLLAQVSPAARKLRPDAVLFDVQTDQKEGVIAFAPLEGLPVIQETPIITMRLAELKGQSVERWRKDPRREIPAWTLRREYRSTYRDHLEDSEKLVAGTWQGRVTSQTSPIPVSVEEGIAKTLGLRLGDEVVFDVQGVPLKAIVASLREVDWRRLQPNFFVVFPAGVLEDAPSFHVLVTRTGSPEKSARMQRELVKQFPNVSTIDLTAVLQTVDSILQKISFVIRFMALFTAGTGLVVLLASVLTGRYQRLQESVLLRTLGASRQQIGRILFVEYACLGSMAAATGIVLSIGASWALSHYVFKMGFSVPPLPLIVAWLIVSAVTALTGLATNRGICNHPPLEALRREV